MKMVAPLQQRTRIQSIDVLRGAIMVLMAIDHVRVYSGLPAGGPSPGIFFTRWVTHFCAPGFVFFAGTSAFLYGLKLNNKNTLSRFLLTRGLLLVVLELTLIRFFWTFNLDYKSFTLAGVIWMLGWCMVIMAALVRLKPMTVGIIGILIILAQQVFSYVPGIFPEAFQQKFGWFWEFIYPSGLESMPGFTVLYVLVPWIGVMAAGYGFGMVLKKDAKSRNRICRWIGIASILLFVVLASIGALSSNNDDGVPFVMRLLNQNKYPPSLLFLLMTLGPIIALVPFAERVQGWFVGVLSIFGRVPMFYYLLHIPLIHLSALLVNLIVSGSTHSEFYHTAPYAQVDPEHKWNLGLLYLVFIIDVVILYFACRWYEEYKRKNPGKKLLKYI